MGKRKPDQRQPRVTIEGEVLRQIRQHARSNSKTEVCGVLIGEETGNGMSITARIPGLNAAQAGTYVTFTQDTWEHIYKIKDKEFPDERIVGWYHSHPGFGVFLSDHDTFIHKNFFSSALQVAWVYDPHSDEEGCFGWAGERLERLSEIHVKDEKGGEEAGETGKPEPVGGLEDEQEADEGTEASEIGPPAWLRWMLMIASYLLLATIAFFVALLLFPRPVYFLLDPARGLIEAPPGTHVSPDGTALSIPGIGDFPLIRPVLRSLPPEPDKNSKPQATEPAVPAPSSGGSPAGSQAAPQGAPKSGNGKDSNVPRK
jgi:proteasome lid subunit RPN8/RPN11